VPHELIEQIERPGAEVDLLGPALQRASLGVEIESAEKQTRHAEPARDLRSAEESPSDFRMLATDIRGHKEVCAMRMRRVLLTLMVLAVGLSLAASPGGAGEKHSKEECQKVWFHAGAQPFYEKCPYPYEGPVTPTGELGCYIAPMVGTLNGTWLYYVPTDNCEFILPADKPGAVWREEKQLWACWGLGVYKTKRGTIFTEAAEQAHSDGFSWPSGVAFTDFGWVIGGTGQYAGATGWIGLFGDGEGGTGGGEICTPNGGKAKK
jgi:hypothetical protein